MNRLLEPIISKLDVVRGPDARGEYVAWCPFHPDGKGKPPHQPNLNVSERGFTCHACGQGGALKKLAEHLGIIENGNSPEKTYSYFDENNRLLFQVCRGTGKRFWQRKPDGNGGWVNGLNSTRRVLFQLPQLVQRAAETVFVVEGEKDVETLMGLGMLATTNPMGAGKWRDDYSNSLKGRDVVVLPDNDDVGKRHAQVVAASLQGKAKSIRIISLPGLKEKGDVTDWMGTGHTKGELLELVNEAPLVDRSKLFATDSQVDKKQSTGKTANQPSDIANAERFADMFHEKALYVPSSKTWFLWNGGKWQEDLHNKVLILGGEAMIGLPPQFQSHKKITYMLEEAKPRMSTDAKIFDQNPFFLNVQNGTLILETRELKPPDPKDYITKQCPVEFNRDATCSDFDDFLNLIMGRKPDMVDYIKVAFGYSLTGITDSHVFFMLYGQTGANGKSTLLTVLKGVMGDYAYHTDIENLLEQRNYIIPAARMEWVGIRLLTTSEVPPNRRLNESLVKDLTGGDEITGRHFYLREWTYRPNLKLWIPGNERPRTTANAGIMRRARSIPFNVKIENPIEGYDRILLREASGILNLGVSGAMRYLDNGFYEPPEVVASTEQFKSDMDTLAPFLEECCIKGNEFEVSHQELYGLYVAWNKVNQNTKPLSGTGFGIRLREQNFEKYRKARWPNGHSGKQINKTFYRGLEINWEAAGQYTGSHEPDMFGGLDEE